MNKFAKAFHNSSKDLIDVRAFREQWNLTQPDLALLMPGKYTEQDVAAWELTVKRIPTSLLKYLHDMGNELQGQVDRTVSNILNIAAEHIPAEVDAKAFVRLVCYTELEDLLESDIMMGRLGLPGLSLHAAITRHVAEDLARHDISANFIYFDAASYKQWAESYQGKPTHEAWAMEQKLGQYSLQ